MKIALVYQSLDAVGGAENVVIWTAESLAKRGHEVVIFTRSFSEGIWGSRNSKPYSLHILDFSRSRSTLKMNAEAGVVLANALSSYVFDIINAHNYPATLWVHYARKDTQSFPPVLIYLHNIPYNYYERQLNCHYRQLPGVWNVWNRYRPKKFFRAFRQTLFHYRRLDQEAVLGSDCVLAGSSYTVDLAKNIYHTKVLFCPLGISPDRFSCNGPDLLHGYAGNDYKLILTVARIELQKNFDTILNAVDLLKKRRITDTFRYIIAGSGPQLSYFKRKSRSMGLDGIIHFLGGIPHENLRQWYAKASFLVHIPLDEPFGLVPLEAALMKKASIVSNHGGPAENVINGITGLHVDALDAREVADKIELFLSNPGQAAAMGEAANNWVRKNLTWDRYIDNLEFHMQMTTSRYCVLPHSEIVNPAA